MSISVSVKQRTIGHQKQVPVAGILLKNFHATAIVYPVTIDLAN
jgi:hypothetical protein